MSRSLYELSAEQAELLDAAERGEDVTAALARIEGDIVQKGTRIVHVMRELNNSAEACRIEAKRLLERARVMSASADRLKAHVMATMRTFGVDRISAPTVTIRVSRSQPSVIVEDVEQVPGEYKTVKVETTVDKRRVLEAWKRDGECVPGTRVEADNYHLTIG